MFHPGYSKKPLHVHNDIVFSCIARHPRPRKAHLESVSSLSADILQCTFKMDMGKVYHLI